MIRWAVIMFSITILIGVSGAWGQALLPPEPAQETPKRNPILYPSGLQTQKANKLLSKFNLLADVEYETLEFSDIKHKLGLRGDELKCSIPHDTTKPETVIRADNAMVNMTTCWQIIYYKSINQTWMLMIRRNNDMSDSWVKIIKVVKGRDPNLNTKWE